MVLSSIFYFSISVPGLDYEFIVPFSVSVSVEVVCWFGYSTFSDC